MVVVGYLVGRLHVKKIDPQTLPLGSQSPVDSQWLEGANAPYSLGLNNSVSHFTSKWFVQTIIQHFVFQFKPNF